MAKMLLSIVLRSIPWDRIIAILCNWLIDKYTGQGDAGQVASNLRHAGEAVAVTAKALADETVTEAEVAAAREVIDAWSDGRETPRDAEATVFPQS